MRDFISQLGFTRDADNIQAVCYHSEFIGDGKPHLAEKDIEELLVAAKVPRPVELSEKVESLVIRRRLNLIVAAPPRTETDNYLARLGNSPNSYVRYALTNQGVDFINTRMQKMGLALTKPTERTELIKEITESLHALIQNIPDQHEREYIEEAISCLSPVNNAPRAAVIMGWTGTVCNLRRKIDQQGTVGYAAATGHLQAINPKAKPVTNVNDLEDIKDVHLLEVCEKMNILKGKSVKKQLVHCLDFRNGLGHPTQVKPSINKVKAFFDEIIQSVLAVP
jgi:hypothetical protein